MLYVKLFPAGRYIAVYVWLYSLVRSGLFGQPVHIWFVQPEMSPADPGGAVELVEGAVWKSLGPLASSITKVSAFSVVATTAEVGLAIRADKKNIRRAAGS